MMGSSRLMHPLARWLPEGGALSPLTYQYSETMVAVLSCRDKGKESGS